MKQIPIFVVIILVTSLLAACAPSNPVVAPPSPTEPPQTAVPQLTPPVQPTTPAENPEADLTRSDGQGAVTVEVKPLNLDKPGETLDFDVSMNTHSVNLGMDLSKLATLTTDNNQPIPATKWDGASGGHHVSGMLSFPTSVDGKPILQGATRITVTISNVDAPSRLFTWQLPN